MRKLAYFASFRKKSKYICNKNNFCSYKYNNKDVKYGKKNNDADRNYNGNFAT